MFLKIFIFIALAGVNGLPFDSEHNLFSTNVPTILVRIRKNRRAFAFFINLRGPNF